MCPAVNLVTYTFPTRVSSLNYGVILTPTLIMSKYLPRPQDLLVVYMYVYTWYLQSIPGGLIKHVQIFVRAYELITLLVR